MKGESLSYYLRGEKQGDDKDAYTVTKDEGLVRFVSIAGSISGEAEKPAIKMKNCTLFKMLRKTLKTLSMIGVRKEF